MKIILNVKIIILFINHEINLSCERNYFQIIQPTLKKNNIIIIKKSKK